MKLPGLTDIITLSHIGMRRLTTPLVYAIIALGIVQASAMANTVTQAQDHAHHDAHDHVSAEGNHLPLIDDNIVWAIDVLAPAFYMQDDKLVGFGADAVDWLIERISHHSIKVLTLPRGRAYEVMHHANVANDHTVCIPGALETPQRARDFIMSNPVFPQLPISLIVKADQADDFAPFMTKNGEVDLPRLLRDNRYYAALETGRSYGPMVDDILREHGFGSHIQRTRQMGEFTGMLQLGRIDWFLAYPIEAEHERNVAKLKTEIKSLPIAGMPDMLEAKVACSKTETGQHVIEHTNTIVAQHPDMPWTQSYVDLLSDADAARYRALIDHRLRSQ